MDGETIARALAIIGGLVTGATALSNYLTARRKAAVEERGADTADRAEDRQDFEALVGLQRDTITWMSGEIKDLRGQVSDLTARLEAALQRIRDLMTGSQK